MSIIRELNGYRPVHGKDCWFAETAVVVGQVTMGDECTVWYNTVLRGDVNAIHIGNKVNIQDGAILHGTYKQAATNIGNNVSVGHGAIVHGCTIHDNVLIGMGAIIMDKAIVHQGAIVAAGAVVSAGTVIGKGEVFAGVPAKKIKMTNEENQAMIQRIADNYPKYASWYQK